MHRADGHQHTLTVGSRSRNNPCHSEKYSKAKGRNRIPVDILQELMAASLSLSLPSLFSLLKGPRKRGNIFAETLFPEMFPRCAGDKHLLRKQNISEQIQKHFCYRNNVSATLFPRLRAP